jgi:uncharacterized membrane protein YccC
LCAALTPFLLLGVFMTTRPALAGYGVGYSIFFCFLAGPDNVIHYDPTSFMNDSMALVLSMLVSSIAFAVLLPPSTPWLRNRLLIDLRRQVVLASRAGLRRVRSRFESGARDLMSQINATRCVGCLPCSKWAMRSSICAAKSPRCPPTRATRSRCRGACRCRPWAMR